MIFKSEDQIFKYIKANEQTPKWVTDARAYHKKLLALIDGENFKDLLIDKIEHLEDPNKALARRKYSRSIVDFYERLLRLVDNVYSSTGGIKRYENLSPAQEEQLKKHLHNIKGGRTLESWLETTWVKNVYHTDPNGIVFLEYDAELGIDPQPSYKSINTIRNYTSNGQKLEVLLFEPLQIEDTKQWYVVDDVKFYTVNQTGDTFVIVDELTFEHHFGMVPALINSNIDHIGYKNTKLSPVDKVVELTEKYARDLSVKNIYQFQAGFPRRWSYASGTGTACPACHGIANNGEGECGTCDGTGLTQVSKDVTTEDVFEIPESGEVVITPGSGYVTPDLAYLADTRIELKDLEDQATFTHWGAVINTEAVATATEVVINTQPVTMRLNKYADQAEYMEMMLTEMIANNMFIDKSRDTRVASISYGRNYIIESTDAILTRYETAKAAGDNSTVLDRLYQEYLLGKYNTDPIGLQIAITKSKVEPYIHYTAEQVFELINSKEAARKISFNDFWKTVTNFDKHSEVLRTEFNAWFKNIYEEPNEEVTNL